jgi:hypothetical protein
MLGRAYRFEVGDIEGDKLTATLESAKAPTIHDLVCIATLCMKIISECSPSAEDRARADRIAESLGSGRLIRPVDTNE